MLIGHPLGASFTSKLKSVAKGAASVVQDERVQRAAVAAAQAYAPQKYAQVTRYADAARGIIRPPRRGGPMPPPQMMPPQMMPQAEMPMEEMAPMPPAGPVQKGNMLGLAAIVGAGLVIFLLLRNR